MRKLILLAVPLALAACAEEPAAEEQAIETEPAAMVTGNGSPAGTYMATNQDGEMNISILNADGTYQEIAADGTVLVEGT